MTRTMPVKPTWQKSLAPTALEAVDRKENVLRGYVLAQEGPFKTPGRGEFDRKSLDMLLQLMKAKANGLKSRFTHPDMSNDGLGKFLGRAKGGFIGTAIDRNGRKVAALRGDLYFDKTALEASPEGGNKPLGVYIMDLAESDPDALSSSVVVEADEEYRLNKDGTPIVDDEGIPLPPLWRPYALHASDIVDTGDAVDGLLSAGVDVDGLPLSVLWKGEQLLESAFADQPREVIEARLSGYLSRYLNRKFGEPSKPEPEPTIETPKLDARRIKLAGMQFRSHEISQK